MNLNLSIELIKRITSPNANQVYIEIGEDILNLMMIFYYFQN